MNWGHLFFSAEGRLGQKDFWMAVAILFVFGVIAHAALGIGTLLWLLSTYCWICLYSKRLHDIGHSGWLQIAPWVLGFILVGAGAVMGLGSLFGLMVSGLPHFFGGMVVGGIAFGAGLMFLSGLMHLLFLIWLGLTPGQTAPNRYGPEPGSPPFPAAA
jgi:uncharacterized membrane protein YhaH (DUF805 family)